MAPRTRTGHLTDTFGSVPSPLFRKLHSVRKPLLILFLSIRVETISGWFLIDPVLIGFAVFDAIITERTVAPLTFDGRGMALLLLRRRMLLVAGIGCRGDDVLESLTGERGLVGEQGRRNPCRDLERVGEEGSFDSVALC